MKKQVSLWNGKSNQRGFSLVELLIVIAIMGVLAVIAFNAFNGVLLNSKAKADKQQATNIQKALKILTAESGVINFSSATAFYKPTVAGTPPTYTAGATAPTGGTALSFPNTSVGVQDLVIALQDIIYVKDHVSKTMKPCGPYLENTSGSATGSYEPYAPQWDVNAGGKNLGYVILVKKASNNISVFPAQGATAPASLTYTTAMAPGIYCN